MSIPGAIEAETLRASSKVLWRALTHRDSPVSGRLGRVGCEHTGDLAGLRGCRGT